MGTAKNKNRIAEILKEIERNQSWLSRHTGISRTTINGICHNKSQPSFDNLITIAKVLKVDINDLIVD